jgi:hypothetical protein
MLALAGCTNEVITVDPNDKSWVHGWGIGGIVNPPGTNNPDPHGENSVDLQCQLKLPMVMTVQFNIGSPRSDTQNANVPVAVIEFSTNGNSVYRKISIYNGATISGPAEYVKVKAFDESEDKLHSGAYNVNILVTPGTRGGTIIPVLMNTATETIDASASHTFPIEQNAGAVLVRFLIGPSSPTATVDLSKFTFTFIDVSSTVINTVIGTLDFIEIPPGAVSVLVQNNDVVNATVRMVLGIDG